MNNSLISINEDKEAEEILPDLRQRAEELTVIISALKEIQETKNWQILKKEIFDELVKILEKQLLIEAQKKEINNCKLSNLTGQLIWAKRYSNLENLINLHKLELSNIRRRLNANE